jgi:FKBP-type peptidyl-prolyl cis-trans isomerase 2
MDQQRAASPGRRVTLHLEIRFQDGSVALSTFDDEPIRCVLGDGTLTPGLESTLIGLEPGRETLILAHGSDLFSHHDPENVHWLEAADFNHGLDPAPGQVIAFETPGGHETSGVVLERDDERVRVDFNHPLCGHPLAVRVLILEVE